MDKPLEQASGRAQAQPPTANRRGTEFGGEG